MLNKVELDLLRELRGKDWVHEDSIEWNKDKLHRTAYFLSTKGLVEIKEEIQEKEIDNSKELLEVLKNISNYKHVRELPSYLIGILKELGAIKVEKGTIVETKYVEPSKEFLEKKGLIKKELSKKYLYKITKEGEKALGESLEGLPYVSSKNLSGPFRRPYLDWANLEKRRTGKYHLITEWKEKIREIFVELGFEEMDGDYVQSSFWNFDMLFQPQDHPSRELADTFYLPYKKELDVPEDVVERVRKEHETYWKYSWNPEEAKKMILRTHTTVLSALTLYKRKTGKFFAIGKVFRNEGTDYKHLAEFHQIEGIISDPSVNFRNLLYILKEFYKRLGYPNIRFRPSYFPYTEPSVEIEAYYEPKKEWVEVGGAGIFREQVSRMLGAPYPILAFGLALERPILLMHPEIKDIRKIYQTSYKEMLER